VSAKKQQKMSRLFKPASVAVIGASSNPGKIGHMLVRNIRNSSFEGDVYPVNPGGGEILGYPVCKSIEELPSGTDVALIAVPAALVLDSVTSLGKKETGFLVIISSGFSEVGETALERAVVAEAKKYGMRILGPNIFGIYASAVGLNATFGAGDVLAGRVSLITQSGALGVAMMGRAVIDRIGLANIVSVGNKADIDDVDLIEYFAEDETTKSVLIYMEGTRRGRELVRTARKILPKKAIVLLKSGRTSAGIQAASSHTGAMAGSDRVFDAAARQCGIQRADDIAEAFNKIRVLSTQPPPTGKGAVIITNGGGVGVMAADAAERFQVSLFSDQAVLEKTFRDAVPSFGSTKNPVDITGQGGLPEYEKALTAAFEEERIGSIIGLLCETADTEPGAVASSIKTIFTSYGGRKPAVFAFIGGEKSAQIVKNLNESGISSYDLPEDAVSSLGALYRWKADVDRLKEPVRPLEIDTAAVRSITDRALSEGRRQLLEVEAKAVLAHAGISVPETRMAKNLEECVAAANGIGYPVVLKISSPDIIHKTEVGGVKVGIGNEDEAISAYRSIMVSARRFHPGARIYGVIVSAMVPEGVETIIGASTDPSFGKIVMFGLGGIYVEVLKDVIFRIPPLGKTEAAEAVASIDSFPLLLGIRGEKPKDISATADAFHRLSHLVEMVPEIAELDVNPLIVRERGAGAHAADARITLRALPAED